MILGSTNGTNGATADTRVGIGTATPGSSSALEIETTTLGNAVFAKSGYAGGNGVYAQCSNGSGSDYGVGGYLQVVMPVYFQATFHIQEH